MSFKSISHSVNVISIIPAHAELLLNSVSVISEYLKICKLTAVSRNTAELLIIMSFNYDFNGPGSGNYCSNKDSANLPQTYQLLKV